jgi:hypothetical protein
MDYYTNYDEAGSRKNRKMDNEKAQTSLRKFTK